MVKKITLVKIISTIIGLAIFCSAVSLFGASKLAPTPIPKFKESAKIDGKLDEAVWKKARKLELAYETRPGENIQASVKTEIFVYYNQSKVFFGLICHDPDPKAIQARFSARDQIDFDDLININLDTFNDERQNYFFGCNALGEQRDGTESKWGNISWDGIWDCSAKITDIGYVIEMAIPFSSLKFPRTKGPQIWGLDISRWYPRDYNRRLGLVKIDRNNNSYQSQFLKIIGFEDVKPGKNIEIIPTLTGIRSDARNELPDGDFEKVSQDFEPGLTAQWGITNNLTLNGTINPDFSQVEADARQLDINQPFALFFDEKRPFFTEGSDYFRSSMNIIHTRTMRDPKWGMKLSGKEGKNTVGLYFVRDNLTNLIFPGNQGSAQTSLDMESTATVLRYKRDIGTNYTVGGIFTNRQGGDYFNRVYGVDGEARLDRKNSISFQVMGTSTRYDNETAKEFNQPLDTFNGRALGLEYQYNSRNFNAEAFYHDIGKDFRADLGFMPRVSYRLYGGGLSYRWIKANSWWSEFQVEAEYEYTKDQDGNFLEEEQELNFNFNGILHSNIYLEAERIRRTYNGVVYELYLGRTRVQFRPIKDLFLFAGCNFGNQIDYANSRKGDRVLVYSGFIYNIGKRVRLYGEHTYERLNVMGQELYTANITQGSLIYHFNDRMFLKGILQYVDYQYNVNNYTFEIAPIYRDLYTQLLFSYRLNPRTVAFLGYTGGYLGNQQYPLTHANRTFFLKVSYSWRI